MEGEIQAQAGQHRGRAPVAHEARAAVGRRLGNGFDRIDDRLVAGAAAVVAGEIFADALARRVRLVAQKRLRRHEDARRAETALQRVGEHEGALQLLDLARVGQALDRVHLAAVGLRGEHETGAHDLAVDSHGARAAHAVLAADVGAGELELVPEEVGEVEARGHAALHPLAVDGERDLQGFGGSFHETPSICLRTRPASTFARCSLVAAEPWRSARGERSASSPASAAAIAFAVAGWPSSARSNCAARCGRSATPKNTTRMSENFFPWVDPCAATPTMA